jgi:hypothetical protein
VSEKLATALLSQGNNEWIFDSGASAHMTHQLELLDNFRAKDGIIKIGKGYVKARSISSVTLNVMTSKGSGMVTFYDVLYVLELVENLLSSETLRLKGLFYRNNTQELFIKDGTIVAEVKVHHGLPHLRISNLLRGYSNNVGKSDIALISSKQLLIATATPAE